MPPTTVHQSLYWSLVILLFISTCLLFNTSLVNGLEMKIQLLRNDTIIKLLNQDCVAGTSDNFTDSCLPSTDHHKPWLITRVDRAICPICEQLAYWRCIEGLVKQYCHKLSLDAVKSYQKPLFTQSKCVLFDHDFDYGLCDDDRLQPGFSWIIVFVFFTAFALITICCSVKGHNKRKKAKALKEKGVLFTTV